MTLVRIADYPQLKLIAWSHRADDLVDEDEALAIYESNWRHIDRNRLTADKHAFIRDLAARYGNGILHV